MKKRYIAGWWKLIFVLLLIVATLVTLNYSLGGSGIRSGGATVKIDRSKDYQLYKVNDEAALYGKYKDNAISLSTYEPAFPLFRIFGEYSYQGELINSPSKQGDWFYVEDYRYMEPGRIIAYNAKTKEKIVKKQAFSNQPQPATELLEKGITPTPSDKVKYSDIIKNPELSVPAESATTTFMAFLFLIVVWLLVLPFAVRKVRD